MLDFGLRCVEIFTVRSVNSGLQDVTFRENSRNVTSCTEYRFLGATTVTHLTQ